MLDGGQNVANLQAGPVSGEDYPDVFDTGGRRDDHPEYEEAVIFQLGSEYQHEPTGDTKQGIQDSELDDGPDTNVFAIAINLVIALGHFDNVQYGCYDRYAQLNEPDDQDRFLKGHPAHRGKAGLTSAHLYCFLTEILWKCDHLRTS